MRFESLLFRRVIGERRAKLGTGRRSAAAGVVGASIAVTLSGACARHASLPKTPSSAPASASEPATRASGTRWRRIRHETFDAPLAEPEEWVEDTYGAASPYHVDAFDDDGEYFASASGPRFHERLGAFRGFRKSFTYGEDGWLTIELYGRDEDRDGRPESGGRVVVGDGRARIESMRHTDAAIVRSTRPLPAGYRIELTVSNVRFGGPKGGGKRVNGYDGDEAAGPWWLDASGGPLPATTDNGVYFLCITDYARPAPHNNVFIHHHRKVVIDTDNNDSPDGPWSSIWTPRARAAVPDGWHYAGLVWLDGESFGNDRTGNPFVSWTPGGFVHDTAFADKYLDGATYQVSIERGGGAYALSMSGPFGYGGTTTYAARRAFRGPPATWHFNQSAEEYPEGDYDQARDVGGGRVSTWPAGSAYPDHFFFGDPHINFYEGSAEYDELSLYVPD